MQLVPSQSFVHHPSAAVILRGMLARPLPSFYSGISAHARGRTSTHASCCAFDPVIQSNCASTPSTALEAPPHLFAWIPIRRPRQQPDFALRSPRHRFGIDAPSRRLAPGIRRRPRSSAATRSDVGVGRTPDSGSRYADALGPQRALPSMTHAPLRFACTDGILASHGLRNTQPCAVVPRKTGGRRCSTVYPSNLGQTSLMPAARGGNLSHALKLFNAPLSDTL